MSPQYKALVVALIWVVWVLPFALFRPKGKAKIAKIDRRAIWGVLLERAGVLVIFIHRSGEWAEAVPLWRLALCLACATVAWGFSWTSVRQLGPQWRIQAGLNEDHQLITTGAYRVVRHPIYASMLWMLLAGIALIGTLPLWPVAVALFILGTEIRVRVEDNLLLERFGEEFETWKRRTPAYFPPIR